MVDPSSFAKLVPGFEFLQGLVKNAGSVVPGIGQWVAPTLNPEELDKRIEELRTVQFWLEQNARMLGATIQALEVQRMTLSTLKTMNVQMNDLRDSLMIPTPAPAPAPAARAPSFFASKPAPAPEPALAPEPAPQAEPPAAAAPEAAKATAPPGVDPMQWWGALTKQFTELATAAMTDGPTGAATRLAGSLLNPTAGGKPAATKPAAKAAVAKPAAKKKPAAKTRRAAPRKRTGSSSPA